MGVLYIGWGVGIYMAYMVMVLFILRRVGVCIEGYVLDTYTLIVKTKMY